MQNETCQTAYLMHYGIKGQRWGLRRFQNEDRSLTQAGKIRYGIGDSGASGQSKKTGENGIRGPLSLVIMKKKNADSSEEQAKLNRRIIEAENRLGMANEKWEALSGREGGNPIKEQKAWLMVDNAQKELKKLNTLQKIQKQTHISQHRLNLQQKYMNAGMSEEDAMIRAYNREKAERILATAAAVTVAGISLYANAQHMKMADRILDTNITLQNLSLDPNKGVCEAFYAAYEPSDKERYLGLFGGEFLQFQGGGNTPVAKLTAKVTSKMKIAGLDVGRDTVKELISSDPEYRKALTDAVDAICPFQFRIHNKVDLNLLEQKYKGVGNAYDALIEGKQLNNDGYNLVNRLLAHHSASGNKAASRLYAALRQKGYDGLLDLNDVLNSGYEAKSPIIVFNKGLKLGELQREVIPSNVLKGKAENEHVKLFMKESARNLVRDITAFTGVVSGVAGVGAVRSSIQRRTYQRRVISAYKKEHPNTKLTDAQILENEIGG